MNTVIGLFAQWKDAKAAIVQLEAKGYDESAMGLLAGPEAISDAPVESFERGNHRLGSADQDRIAGISQHVPLTVRQFTD